MAELKADIDPREYLITAIARRLSGSQHVAVGASSPLPAAAALLAQQRNPALRVSLLGDQRNSAFTDGGKELFDCAAQGRIDTFFLSGVQIDGHANINLVGIGQYPKMQRRFSGSFGSAYLYHLVPKVILFCWSHKPAALVDKVDFISAAGPRDDGVFRPGGPVALVTNRCAFAYDSTSRCFKLAELMPSESVESIAKNTSFSYRLEQNPTVLAAPNEADLSIMRTNLADQLRETYPVFVDSLWSIVG